MGVAPGILILLCKHRSGNARFYGVRWLATAFRKGPVSLHGNHRVLKSDGKPWPSKPLRLVPPGLPLSQEPDRNNDPNDDHRHDQRGTADPVLDGLPALAGQITQEHGADRPGHSAEDIEGQEAWG